MDEDDDRIVTSTSRRRPYGSADVPTRDEFRRSLDNAIKAAEREAEFRSGLRWARNILVELQGNHGKALPAQDQALLRDALKALGAIGV